MEMTLAPELVVLFNHKYVNVPRFRSALSARLIASMHLALATDNAISTHIVASRYVWIKIASDRAFIPLLDQETDKSRVLAGYCGTLFGIPVVSDCYISQDERDAMELPVSLLSVVCVRDGCIHDSVSCIVE